MWQRKEVFAFVAFIAVMEVNSSLTRSASISTSTSIDDDGRLSIKVRQRKNGVPNFIYRHLRDSKLRDTLEEAPLLEDVSKASSYVERAPPPPLNIVIQIVGSRGDVQPFVALGLTLKNTFGHRVRIATHAVFKGFVEQHGLEFFNIGGNSEQLMAYMVRNPGILPSYEAVRTGDVKMQRINIQNILNGCWRSCIEPGNGMQGQVGGAPANLYANQPKLQPFVADAIIANPPSFAHIHCAERLGLPLHLMFTMPYSPTESFPHPLANIRGSDLSKGMTNRLSYALIEQLTWHGLGDLINKFRQRSLGLEPLNLTWATGLITRLKIPYTYCWSPTLLPKPVDWGSHISISGFYQLPAESSFSPSPELERFLQNGEPPVYIGFGSIIVDNPRAMTSMVLEAVAKTGVRALVSKGWGGLGTDDIDLPESIFLLGNVPHTWLFDHVAAVVHHGGAGTTAAGLTAGKPTVIVPFFGDQFFWGHVVANLGAGPRPIPYAKQTADTLAQHILVALQPEVKIRARNLGHKLQRERGCESGARSFHQNLNIENSVCSIIPSRVAVWIVKGKRARLSALAASVLLDRGHLTPNDLRIYRQKEYNLEDRPTDPLSGGASAFLGSFGEVAYETFNLPRQVIKAIRKDLPKENTTQGSSSSVHTIREGIVISPSTIESDISNGGSSLEMDNEREDNGSIGSAYSAVPLPKSVNVALVAGKGITRLGTAVLSSPLHFSLGIARGFQNIPILYGDTRVRKPKKVTGLISGLEVAGKELAYGFYDGVTGVVTQPIHGMAENGALGFITGIGKGLGGLILKPGAGIFGLPAYTFQGISQELHHLFGKNFEVDIVVSRLLQGEEERKYGEIEEEERIVRVWFDLLERERQHVNSEA